MLQDIFNILESIGNFFTNIVEFVSSLFENLINLFKFVGTVSTMFGKMLVSLAQLTTLNITNAFAYIVTGLGVVITVIVLYKILGREG